MQIKLQQVNPVFLETEKLARSEVWGKELIFQKGENVQIVAPSGSGKTSLVHFLYGLRHDYTGTITADTMPVTGADADALARWRQEQVSIVFQDLRLFGEQTVWQNIAVKRVLNPFHPSEDCITAMANRLGIGNKLQKPAKTCSYGEQQRIAIIRSLMQPFGFLLLDEPFSHLDEANRHKAMDLMQEEATARGAAIVLADLRRIDYFTTNRIVHL